MDRFVRVHFYFLVFVLLLLPSTKSVLTQREVPATGSSLYASVLYTAMLRTSVAAVVLGCFYFCPLDGDASIMVVDCACVKTGCMPEKYIPPKRLILMQSEKFDRKSRFPIGDFFDGIVLDTILIVNRIDFIGLYLFLEAFYKRGCDFV